MANRSATVGHDGRVTAAQPGNTTPLHADRRRAESFGSVAERYERARPGYPDALMDELTSAGPCAVLDVGTGTGKAARMLQARWCTVLGVEPDARMAEVARSRGVAVEVARFEEWAPRRRTFEMLTAAQAWHWVDPAVGPAKAASVIRPGGRLALFWSHLTHRPDALAPLTAVYRRYAPELAEDSLALGSIAGRDDFRQDLLAVGQSGGFDPLEVGFFDWHLEYPAGRWLDYLGTCSDHIALQADRRDALLEAVGRLIDRDLGGSLTVEYRTVLVSCRRR